MYKNLIQSSLMVFLISLSGHAWAANYSDPIDGTFRGVYGDTISVEVPSLISKSPVANENENGDLSFQVNANTGYRNFNQLTDLKQGDPVRVEYTQDLTRKDKQMVASVVTKIEPMVVASPVGAVINTDTASAPVVTQTVTTTTTTKVDSQ